MKMVISLDGSKFTEDFLEPASRIARKMVAEYGMSAALGPRSFDTE